MQGRLSNKKPTDNKQVTKSRFTTISPWRTASTRMLTTKIRMMKVVTITLHWPPCNFFDSQENLEQSSTQDEEEVVEDTEDKNSKSDYVKDTFTDIAIPFDIFCLYFCSLLGYRT